MAEQLQIAIGADVSGLQTGLSKAEDAVKKFDNSVKKSVAVTDRAKQALVNFGRVASDAPFGFIAIANNIEPLVQSFQSFGRSSDDAKVKLRALATQLAGPTGLLLAFSLVSSAVTFLTQKYGSLGNAINAIFGNFTELDKAVSDAAKSYEEYNKKAQTSLQISEAAEGGVQGQLATVNALVKIAGDQTAAYGQRNAALKELATINKDYFGDLRIENGLIIGLTDAVDGYTASLVASAKVKGFEDAISRLAPQLSEQKRLLEELRAERDRIAKLPAKIVGIAATRDLTQLNEANAKLKEQEDAVKKLTEEDDRYQKQLSALTDEIVRNKVALSAAQKAAADKLAADLEATRVTEEYAKAEARLNAEFNQRAKEREKLRAKAGQVSGFDIFTNQQAANAAQPIEQKITQLDKFKAALDKTLVAPESLKFAEQVQAQALTNAQERLQALQAQVQVTQEALAAALGPAIDGVFNAIANGTSVIDSLKDSLKRLLVQLAANAAKAFLLKTALNFIPGGQILGGAGLLGGGGGLGGILGGLLGGGSLPAIGRTAAPSFTGSGITGGNLNLAGNVVFTQRGTDLVGVLNAGNARINRVG